MEIKSKPAIIAGMCALAAVAFIGSQLFRQQPAMAAASPVAAPPPQDTGELQFARGAAQLAMIRSQTLAALPMPAGDAMNARVVYDEDVTARVGVSVAGRVMAIKASPGDQVKAGQVLAEIDSPDYGAALADLSKARADQELKRQVMERAKALVPGEGIAGKDLESARADYAQASAETVRAEQRVNNISPRAGHASGQRIGVVSPVAGVVTERAVTPALEVAAGAATPLFVVTDQRHLWLLIDVPESRLSSIGKGAALDVESDAFPGEHFKATVSQAGLAVDPDTRRVVVRARLDNPDGKLLPEMYVRSTPLQGQGSAVQVPNSALVNRGLYTYVFVQTAPGHFQRREVKMLTHGGTSSYISGGVKGNEDIVTTGALLLDAEMSARAGGG